MAVRFWGLLGWVSCRWVIDIMPMVPVVAHLMAKIVNGIWFGILDCNWVGGWLAGWLTDYMRMVWL